MRRRVTGYLAAAPLLVFAGLIALPEQHATAAGGFDWSRPEVVTSGLVAPWGLAFLGDGSALVSERDSARILRVGVGRTPTVVTTVPGVTPAGEGGLLGLAVEPGGGTDPWVYAYFTAASDNRIVRFRLSTPSTQQVILSGLAKANFHDGGRIAFGPDGLLYAGVGDAGTTASAQNLSSRNGKILRMTPDGGVPAGNPFSGSLVYSYGHRNVQGLTWDAQGRLWASEFGQNTWDELNQIVAGGNYGWPTVEGRAGDSRFRDPAIQWTTAEASPSGAAFANGTVFVAALRGARLWTVPVDANGAAGTPVAELVGAYGRLRTVALGPDGYLWLSTSNRDGRGTARAGDDQIRRFPPTGVIPTTTTTTTTTRPTTTTTTTTRPTTTTTTTTTTPTTTTTTTPTTTTTTPTTTTTTLPTTTTTTRPTTTTTTTTTRPTTTTGGGSGCSAAVTVAGQWPGGFQGEIRVTNLGTTQRTSWTVTFVFPAGQQVTQGWSGQFSQAGSTVTVRNAPWNGTLAPGGSTVAGFLASWSGTNPPATTVTCS